MLGPVLQHVVSMANFSVTVMDAVFYAKSTGEGPTLQLNDLMEKFSKQLCVGRRCVQIRLVSLTFADYSASIFW